MNIQIITSSYPAFPGDPNGTAGLFVRDFALALMDLGHKVIVQPAGKESEYIEPTGIIVAPTPWEGGNQELGSMNLRKPKNWRIITRFLVAGYKRTLEINSQFSIDLTLCMWVVPSGIFGRLGQLRQGIPYDVWALGSDIWKIRNIPVLGPKILRHLLRNADHVFADGMQLCSDVERIGDVKCRFLPSSRRLPPPDKNAPHLLPRGKIHFLYTGRYHPNKGPDLLLEAFGLLPPEIKNILQLHMFGFGPLEPQLKDLIRDLAISDCVSLGGPLDAQGFSNHLLQSSYLVIPSRIESIPVVFSDALQMGVPVIATPVGDLPLLVNRFRCGLVAQDTSASALSKVLQEATALKKDSFSKGITQASQQFDIVAAAKNFIASMTG